VGEVIRQGSLALSETEPERPTLYRVIDNFQGADAPSREMEVWSKSYRGLEPGTRWVIDALRKTEGDETRVVHRACDRGGHLNHPDPGLRGGGDEFLQFLRKRRKGVAPTTVEIRADVSRLAGVDSLGQVRVELLGAEHRYRFEIRGEDDLYGYASGTIQPDDYQVEVSGGNLPFLFDSPIRFTPTAGACSYLYLPFGHNTGIEGRVTRPDGSPAEHAGVSIRNVVSDRSGGARVGEDGRFSHRGMAPGEYLVSANLAGFHQTFYPGSTQAPGAPVRVDDGAKLSEIDLVLAEKAMSKITLYLVYPDGEPAGSELLTIKRTESIEGRVEGQGYSWESETDYRGTYAFESPIGARLEVSAYVGDRRRFPVDAGTVTIDVVNENHQVEVILEEKLCQTAFLQLEPCPEPSPHPSKFEQEK